MIKMSLRSSLISSLALVLCGTVACLRPRVAPGEQVARVSSPVALEGLHRKRNRIAGEPMRAQLGADEGRPIARAGAAAHQRFGKTRIVLPAGSRQLVDGGLGITPVDPPAHELATKLLAGMFPPGQQAQRALQG